MKQIKQNFFGKWESDFNNAEFFIARQCHPSPFGIIKIITCFSRFELCFYTKAGYIFCFLTYKTLKAIVTLFFSIFFQSFFSDGICIPFQLYLFIKGLIFVILSERFPISSSFNATVIA